MAVDQSDDIRQLGNELGSMLVRDVVSPDVVYNDNTGLSYRVEEIMRRESPPRQAYRLVPTSIFVMNDIGIHCSRCLLYHVCIKYVCMLWD